MHQAAAARYSQLGKNFLHLTTNADTARYSHKLRYNYRYKYKFSVYGQRCLKVHQAAAARYSQLGKNFLPLTTNADTARYSHKLRYKYRYKYKFSVYGQRCLKVHQAAAARYSQLGKEFSPFDTPWSPHKAEGKCRGYKHDV